MTSCTRFSAGEGRYEVWADVMWMGADLVVLLGGGTKPHVGAVSVAFVHESLAGGDRVSCTPSLLTLPTHKEYEIALVGAEKLARVLERSVVVIAGIHLDNASAGDVVALTQNASGALDQVLIALSHERSSPGT